MTTLFYAILDCMELFALEGYVDESGGIRLLTPSQLPPNTKVMVVVANERKSPPERVHHIYSPRLANPQDAAEFTMEVTPLT